MNNWLNAINFKLKLLEGLPGEDAYVALQFCDGHAVHTTTLADLKKASQALALQLAQANDENGDLPQLHQRVIELFAIVSNVHIST